MAGVIECEDSAKAYLLVIEDTAGLGFGDVPVPLALRDPPPSLRYGC